MIENLERKSADFVLSLIKFLCIFRPGSGKIFSLLRPGPDQGWGPRRSLVHNSRAKSTRWSATSFLQLAGAALINAWGMSETRKKELLRRNISKWVPHLGLRASADRVNVWNLLYILKECNHHGNVKWTKKYSLHVWDHIVKLIIIIACYMHYIHFVLVKDGDTTRHVNIHKCLHL